MCEQSRHEQSPTAKKIWLFYTSPCLSALHRNQCGMSHYLASVGARNLILYICRNRVSAVATYSCHVVSILIGTAITQQTP